MKCVQEPASSGRAKLCPKPTRRKRKPLAEPQPMIVLITCDGTVAGLFRQVAELRAFLQGSAA